MKKVFFSAVVLLLALQSQAQVRTNRSEVYATKRNLAISEPFYQMSSLEEINRNNPLQPKLYPNPVIADAQLTLPEDSKVYLVAGNKKIVAVWYLNKGIHTLPLNGFPEGAYVLVFDNINLTPIKLLKM